MVSRAENGKRRGTYGKERAEGVVAHTASVGTGDLHNTEETRVPGYPRNGTKEDILQWYSGTSGRDTWSWREGTQSTHHIHCKHGHGWSIPDPLRRFLHRDRPLIPFEGLLSSTDRATGDNLPICCGTVGRCTASFRTRTQCYLDTVYYPSHNDRQSR